MLFGIKFHSTVVQFSFCPSLVLLQDNKVLFQQMVTPVIYYLSVMCIAKYSSILSHREHSKCGWVELQESSPHLQKVCVACCCFFVDFVVVVVVFTFCNQ